MLVGSQIYFNCKWLQLDSNPEPLRPVWPNCRVFVYELNGSGFESSCCHVNVRFCFKQGVPWHSGNYKVWIHSETRMWHDKNIQSNLNCQIFQLKGKLLNVQENL